jgi:hypothetical protein
MASADLNRPTSDEYPPEVSNYICLVQAGSLPSILSSQLDELLKLVGKLSDEQSLVCQPPYTWSIKQVLGHLIDSERVFGYRAMRLARNDETPLPGFDENAYMRYQDFDRIPLTELVAEFESLRQSHVLMLRHFSTEAWSRRGIVNGNSMTARAVACVLAGHSEHHVRILQQRLSS